MRRLVALLVCAFVAGCGGVSNLGESADAASTDAAAPRLTDATAGTSSDAGVTGTACIPGRSIGCTGPGGCSSSQVCKSDGSGFGACNCSSPTPMSDASTMACVPGQSIACSGPGGCISSQVCEADGSGYGACPCSSDGAALSCIPGQSIACAGADGCISYQICNSAGDGYDPCVCPDGGGYDYGDGGLPDGYAPLPPPIGNQGYNAIWAPYPGGTAPPTIYRPLFSAPDCAVVPPYGDAYIVEFQPQTAGPTGTFQSCTGFMPGGPQPCYLPAYSTGASAIFEGGGQGFTYTLSPFDANGIATGQMDTAQGIVPLVVKNCF